MFCFNLFYLIIIEHKLSQFESISFAYPNEITKLILSLLFRINKKKVLLLHEEKTTTIPVSVALLRMRVHVLTFMVNLNEIILCRPLKTYIIPTHTK